MKSAYCNYIQRIYVGTSGRHFYFQHCAIDWICWKFSASVEGFQFLTSLFSLWILQAFVYSYANETWHVSEKQIILSCCTTFPYQYNLCTLVIPPTGNATEVYIFGTQFCMCVLGMVFGGLLVYHIVLPLLYNMNLISLSQVSKSPRNKKSIDNKCRLFCTNTYFGETFWWNIVVAKK